MKNQMTEIAQEMIDRNMVNELIELKNSMIIWIPVELLDEDNYQAYHLIKDYLEREDIKTMLEGMNTIL